VLLLLIVAVAMTVVCAVAAAPAVAAPTEPTLVGSALQDAINAAGPTGLDGYFNTVLKGSEITPVSVKILAVADGQNPNDGSPLILFQITDANTYGAEVLAQGGLAEGMSGSPLRVGNCLDPQDTDPLVGAVSYGDIFTTNGLGFATPIDLMSSIETNYTVEPAAGAHALASPLLKAAGPVLPKTRTFALARPLKTAAGTFGKFIVARNHAAASALHPVAGTAVFVPLSAVEVGGVPTGSRAFNELSAQLAKRGIDIIPAGGGVGGGDGDPPTPLVGGASVAAVLSHGYFWAAFVGTVTYSHDVSPTDSNQVVVAFGHPADYDGASGLEMANASVSGIWSTSYIPYKLVSLGAIRGLITQDRLYGIAGVTTDDTPSEVPVNATAKVGSGAVIGAATYVPTWVADNLNWGSEMISDACYFPVFKATDAFEFPGFVTTDTVVKVADENGTPVTPSAELKNVWDDMYDVGYYSTYDVMDMVDYLTSNPNGTAPGTVTEVDFSALISPTHRSTEMLDFSIPGGLRIGNNVVRTVLRDYGEVGTHEVDVTLNVPAKSQLTGDVEVAGSADGFGYDDYYDDDYDDSVTHSMSRTSVIPVPGIPTIPDSESLQDLVNDVNAWPINDTLDVAFTADVNNPDTVPIGPDGLPTNIHTSSTTVTDGTTPWYVEGDLDKYTSQMILRPQSHVVVRGHTVRLLGLLDAEDSNGTTVAIFRGAATKPFATVRVHVDSHGNATFATKVKLGTATTTFRAVWDGSESYIGSRASCKVLVVRHK
jgi:hypothetical protein